MIPTLTEETVMRTPKLTGERGMALAVAIFALVVVGALVAGAFYAANLEQRTGRSSMYATQAADAAEAGSAAVLADWDAFNLNNLAVGSVSNPTLSFSSLGAHLSVTPTVTRLNNDLFLISTLAQRKDLSNNVLAQRTVATMARLTYVTATANSAVTAGKSVNFNGVAFTVDGNDKLPTDWTTEPDCTTGAAKAGVRTAETVGANTQQDANILGDPPQVEHDPTVTSSFFNIFGDVTFDDLKKSADIVLPLTTPYNGAAPSLTAGVPQRCNTADQMNWGEPHRSGVGYTAQCVNYFPILYGSGTKTSLAAGGRGQGLLLVEGDLEISGGFEWTGLIVAKGGIKVVGNGNKITGALLAQDVAVDDQNTISGNTTLQFSSCALNKAIKGSAVARPLSQRSWVQMY
jgi:Tfp pilus assembly protein PilX